MTLTVDQAKCVLALAIFAESEGCLNVEDAQLCMDLYNAYPELRVSTTPYELDIFMRNSSPEAFERAYTTRLQNMLRTHKTLTIEQLAERLGKSVEWIKEHMKS